MNTDAHGSLGLKRTGLDPCSSVATAFVEAATADRVFLFDHMHGG
jgi:hypothetical protein